MKELSDSKILQSQESHIINIAYDDIAKVHYATCDKIGISLESRSYDNLIDKVISAVPEMAELNNIQCEEIVLVTKERHVIYKKE